MIEKPRNVNSQLKGCGLYVFDPHIFDAIRRTPRTAMRDEYEITDTIQILINDGYMVHHQPIVERDLNLTKPDDLLTINLIELARAGLTRLVDDSATVTVLDNLSVGTRGAVPEGARFVHGDIRDAAAVTQALSGVDCVFHLAAQVTIRGSFDRFYQDLDTNVMGTAPPPIPHG